LLQTLYEPEKPMLKVKVKEKVCKTLFLVQKKKQDKFFRASTSKCPTAKSLKKMFKSLGVYLLLSW
jgi:hypothetical protein